MKFRRLSLEELEELRSEFINFLAVNGYGADDWESFQKMNDPRHDEMILLFSDMVMEKVLVNIKFLEHRSENSLMLFNCLSEELLLTSVNITKDVGVSFNDQEAIKIVLETDRLEDGLLSHFSTTKRYTKSREEDIFELTQGGCMVITEEYYKKITDSLK